MNIYLVFSWEWFHPRYLTPTCILATRRVYVYLCVVLEVLKRSETNWYMCESKTITLSIGCDKKERSKFYGWLYRMWKYMEISSWKGCSSRWSEWQMQKSDGRKLSAWEWSRKSDLPKMQAGNRVTLTKFIIDAILRKFILSKKIEAWKTGADKSFLKTLY